MLGLIEALRRSQEDVRPGDMFVGNDPYVSGGTHLPDITIVAPVFADAELVGYVANIGHHNDVGGMMPGSSSVLAGEIVQEGLRLPPVRIFRDGAPIRDIVSIVALNSRLPNQREGDLWAQLSANLVGVRAVEGIVRRHGLRTVQAAMTELLDHAERRFRARVRELPDGSYAAVQYLDNDGLSGDPVRIQVAIEIRGDDLSIDFSGTAGQVRTSRNVPPVAGLASIFCVLKSLLDPHLPPNSGYFRAVRVNFPEGSLLNPRAPAAVADRAHTCQIVSEAVILALSQAMPDGAIAASGPLAGGVFSGIEPESGSTFVDYESYAGALGARRQHDGMDAIRVHHSNAANLPVECLEALYPLRVERYELAADSGGAGEWRGGLGQRRDYRVLTNAVRVHAQSERQRAGAPGIYGGHDGAPARFVVNPGPQQRVLSSLEAADLNLTRGDLLRIETAGGGGYGDPKLRVASSIQQDLREGRITKWPS
jgi:N-methylhydantoinase B